MENGLYTKSQRTPMPIFDTKLTKIVKAVYNVDIILGVLAK